MMPFSTFNTFSFSKFLTSGMRIACLCFSSAIANAQIDDATATYIETEIAKGNYPGVMIAIVQDDAVTYHGFGLTDKTGGTTPNENTVFETGSLTKTFTATLLAQMLQTGDMALDDPVQNYLPEGITLAQTGERPITIADLATQRSGLPRQPPDINPAAPLDPYADFDAEDLWRNVDAVMPEVGAGERYEYSNFAFSLLGEILARKAGLPYQDLLRRQILEPLAMNDSDTRLSSAMREHAAVGHDQNGEPTPYWTFNAMASAGAINSTAKDLVQYLRLNLGQVGPEELRKAAALAHEPRADMDTADIRLGLAWNTMPFSQEQHWHDGITFGFRSFVGLAPASRRAVLIWTNTSHPNDPLNGIGMHLLDPDKVPLPAPWPERRTEITLPAEQMATYAGSYQMEFDQVLTLRIEDGLLLAQLPGQQEIPLYPEAPDRFFFKVVDAQLEFTRDADGNVTAVTLHQNGQSSRGNRQ